jgi:hypothetical protein
MVLATGLAAFVSPAGAAGGSLDQSQTNFNASLAFGGVRQAAQTFTAGLSGNLDQVDVHVRFVEPPSPPEPEFPGPPCTRGSGITVEFRTAMGGTPTDTTLSSASVPALSVPTTFGFVSATFPAPAAVTAGTQYALVLSAPDAICTESFFFPYEWGGATGNPYAGGFGYVKLNAPSSWAAQNDYDNAFRTYVDTTTPPPETPHTPGAMGGPGPPGAPSARESARTLTISYNSQKGVFRGRLVSQASACVASQKVAVFEQKKGKDPKLGSSTTKANGSYSLKRERSEGRFYARAGLSSSSGVTCLATQSKAIKLRG